MLKDDALKFYHNFYYDGQKHSVEEICKDFKEKFEGVQHRKGLLNTWNRLTFDSVGENKDNIGKNKAECLRILTRRLTVMQHGLDMNLRNCDRVHHVVGHTLVT
ncbi:hypothetical protein GcC1_217034 [Golovinomyces cichoracearum]|uniref:Uncharacterized protein n=1 Tax=Golovinomyces cichoracearum TaxID=62708 RepID=A0A420H8T5_9PEZI|nr:hypothetical protein GcC1_217034 [Golovinomyces cichoracearum]